MTGRWPLPDLARGVAILAMLVAHAQVLVPFHPAEADAVLGRVNDVAAPLFVVVMGMSAAVMLERAGERIGRVLLHNTVRGAVLIALGIWLETWGSWVAIILAILGCLLIVGTPLLLLGRAALVTLAVVVFAAAPTLNAAVQRLVDWPGGYYANIENGPSVGELLIRWFVADPHYRVTSLLPFFVAGALLARGGFAERPDRRWSAATVLVGLGTEALVSAARSAGIEEGSGSALDMVHDAALVAVVLGGCALLVSAPFSRLLGPVEQIGTVALSLYVLQIAVIAVLNRDGALPVAANDWSGFALIVVGVAAVAWAWARWVGRGPIEWLTGLATGRYARPRRRPATS